MAPAWPSPSPNLTSTTSALPCQPLPPGSFALAPTATGPATVHVPPFPPSRPPGIPSAPGGRTVGLWLAAWLCPRAWLGGWPSGGPVQGFYLNLPTAALPVTGTGPFAVLLTGHGRGPASAGGDLGTGALFRRSPMSLAPSSCHLALDIVWLGPGGRCGQQVLLPPPPTHIRSLPHSHLSTWAQGPQQGDRRLGHTGPAWPHGLSLPPAAWLGRQWGEGTAGTPLLLLPSAAARVLSVPPPEGTASPAACPLVPVAQLCGVAPLSLGWSWAGVPPTPSAHSLGCLCRFLNVILKSGK